MIALLLPPRRRLPRATPWPTGLALVAYVLTASMLTASAQREAEQIGSLPPAAAYARVETVDGEASGYLTSDPTGEVTEYDLTGLELWSSQLGAFAEVRSMRAWRLPVGLAADSASGQIVISLRGDGDDRTVSHHTALVNPLGEVVSEWADRGAWVYEYGGKSFVELERRTDGYAVTLLGAGLDTLYRSEDYGRLLDFGKISLAGEPHFYALEGDSVRVVGLAGLVEATYPSRLDLGRFGQYGSTYLTRFLSVDVLADGIPDFALEVTDGPDDEGSNYLAIVDATSRVVADTTPPATNERPLLYEAESGLLKLTTLTPVDSLGRQYTRSLAVYDPADLRELAQLNSRDNVFVGTYDARPSLFYYGQDTVTFFDPVAARRQVSLPRALTVGGDRYEFGGFVNFADTATGYGDAVYSTSGGAPGPSSHLTVDPESNAVFAFTGGDGASVYRAIDGGVYAQTRADQVDGVQPESQLYELISPRGASAVDESAPPVTTAPLFAPNPTRGDLTFVSDVATSPARVRVYTLAGTLAREYAGVAPGQSLSLALPPGLYLVEAAGPTGERRASRLVVR